MEDIADSLGGSGVLETDYFSKNLELLYVDMYNPNAPTLVYDAKEFHFLVGVIHEVEDLKDSEYDIEHRGFENLTKQLNLELDGIDERDWVKRLDVGKSLINNILNKIGGLRVIEPEIGNYLYVQRNVHREYTIFFDAEEKAFLAGDFNGFLAYRFKRREQ
jgi:hypothetical protein